MAPHSVSGRTNPQGRESLTIWSLCPGVGHWRRGFESCFTELHATIPESIESVLFGGGHEKADFNRIWTVYRSSGPAKLLAKLCGCSPYHVEAAIFAVNFLFWGLTRRSSRPDVILTSDTTVLKMLHRLQVKRLGKFRESQFVLWNGAPGAPPYDYCDKVVHVTPGQAVVAANAGEPSSKRYVVPLGVAEFSKLERSEARRQLGISASARVILLVSAVDESRKRLGSFAEAAADYFRENPETLMLVVGESGAESASVLNRIKRAIGDRQVIVVSAPFTQMPLFYSAADAYVIWSTNEGFGRATVEAMLAGLPCVAADSATARYVLQGTGHLADPGGADLPAALTAAIGGRTSESAARTRISALKHYSWSRVWEQLVDVFES